MLLLDWRMKGMDGVEVSQRIREDERFSSLLNIIMVTAGARDELVQAADGMDLSAVLIKPVTPSTMLETLFGCLGGELAERNPLSSGKIIQDLSTDSLNGRRVLLVEDNEMNQEVALELLENVGITVVIANNGQEALEVLKNGSFDLVLMDLQMPVMDGYQATRSIRRQSKFKMLPVVAMTANAMSGDREKCLEIGMNDHISKPINVRDMYATLVKWMATLPCAAVTELLSKQEQQPHIGSLFPELRGIDVVSALSAMGDNEKLYRKMLNRFYQTQHDFVESFEKVWASGDTEQAARNAHTLKGLAGTIGARRLQEAVAALEIACGDWLNQKVSDKLGAVAEEFATVLGGLAAVVDIADVAVGTNASNVIEYSFFSVAIREQLREAASNLDKATLLTLLTAQHDAPVAQIAHLTSLAESYRFDLIEKILSDSAESRRG
jgi:CheY-like chemotaxis protein